MFYHPDKDKRLGFAVTLSSERILMASSSHSSATLGHCIVSLHLSGREYKNIKLSVMANLCCDLILGHSFLCKHFSVEIPFGWPFPPLTVCRLTAIYRDTEPDPMPGDLQELDVLNPSNAPSLLQSTTENSAAENSVPAISLPPLLDDSQRTLSEDADSLNLRRSSRTRQRPLYITENYQL